MKYFSQVSSCFRLGFKLATSRVQVRNVTYSARMFDGIWGVKGSSYREGNERIFPVSWSGTKRGSRGVVVSNTRVTRYQGLSEVKSFAYGDIF
jgi:hypothetical protein